MLTQGEARSVPAAAPGGNPWLAASGGRLAGLSRRVPGDRLQQVQLAFVAFACGSAVLLALSAGSRHGLVALAAALGLALLVAAVWVAEYRGARLPVAVDFGSAAAILGAGVATGGAVYVLVLLYVRICVRALEGSSRRTVYATLAYSAAYLGTAFADASRALPFPALLFLGTGFPLCALVMHGVAGAMAQREVVAQLRIRLAHEAAAREREEGFRLMFAHNPQPMWLYDLETLRFLEVNDAAVERYGYSHEEFLGMRIVDIRPPAEVDELLAAVHAERPHLQDSGLWTHRLKDDRDISVRVRSHRLQVAGRDAVLVLAEDVTEQLELEEQLRRQAFHDPLTGLANRALFVDRVEHALSRRGDHKGHATVLFIDIDNFKTLNDSMGHAAGDELLVQLGRRLESAMRPEDTVARLGGDEFAILVDTIAGRREAIAVGQRALAAVHRPFELGGEDWFVSVSLGVALDDGRGVGPEAIMRSADTAMYSAKAERRGGLAVFEPEMHAAVVQRVTLEAELRSAIQKEQLRVHYQPQVDLSTGAVVGVEALVRWQHPERGLVMPDEFIAVAEESALIHAIDAWVLREAARQVRAWEDAGMKRLRVGVNVSARELLDDHLAQRVADAISESGIEAKQLEIEVTESVAVETAGALPVLSRMHDSGVRIVIDDFGVGYSVLSRLRTFPVDKLKIDRSFIREIVFGEGEAPLVSGIVAMAHGLDLKVVAEGVETTEQMRFLRRLGCDEAQGYCIGKPVPPDAIAELLRR